MQSQISDQLNLMAARVHMDTERQPEGDSRRLWPVHDWYESNLYDQTLRVNGMDQRDVLILNPDYPDPLTGVMADVQPGGRIQASQDLKMPKVHQASIGVERQVTPNLSMQTSYPDAARPEPDAVDEHQPAGRIRGVCPAGSTVGTITQFDSTGCSQSDRVKIQAPIGSRSELSSST